MESDKDVNAFISESGLTYLAQALSEKTGAKFTAQQLNHWKKRGVPYRWLDDFAEISGISKEKLRSNRP